MHEYELFGAASCPHTRDMREWLDWKGYEYTEYDVEADDEARAHMIGISGGQRMVPVLVQDGVVIQIGWQGHGCVVSAGEAPGRHA